MGGIKCLVRILLRFLSCVYQTSEQRTRIDATMQRKSGPRKRIARAKYFGVFIPIHLDIFTLSI